MALNQIIESPLVLYSGSIVGHTNPTGTAATMVMLSSSLPVYNRPFFQYRINQRTLFNTTTTQQAIPDLQVTLLSNTNYVINASILVSSNSAAAGVRIGFTATNVTSNVYNIETPISATSTILGINQTAAALASPSGTVSNFYYVMLKALVRTATTGTPTIVPTFSTEVAGNIATIGPSSQLIYVNYTAA